MDLLVNGEYFLDGRKRTKAHPKSTEYRDWWLEQKKRCLEGYTVGGKFMPPSLYWYMNFWTIELFNEQTQRKSKGFPMLRDIDWEFAYALWEARKQNKGIMWIAGRRAGKTFGCGAEAGREYTFFADNELCVGAHEESKGKGMMEKIRLGLEGLKDTYFYHARIKDDISSELRSGYRKKVNGVWNTHGYNSRIFNLNFKNNHTAANSKSSSLFLFEEVGMFDNLLSAYNSSEPCWKEGSRWFGTPVLLGTGGDMEKGSIDAQKMFYDPETYNLLSFQIPDSETKVGFFTPGWKCLNDHKAIGDDGITLITNEVTAKAAIEQQRENKKKGNQKDAYFKELQYYPNTPDEAFIQSTGNVFPQDLLNAQLHYLLTNKKAKNLGQYGHLAFNKGGNLTWKPDGDLQEAEYPFSPKGRNEGCIVIYEHPSEGYEVGDTIEPPYGLYIAGLDPYEQNEAASSDSLGSFMIYKRFYSPAYTNDWVVAEYTGRPKNRDEYYENVRKLLIHYNAKCLYENDVRGFKEYMEEKKSLRYLAAQPQIIKDIHPESSVARGYGMHSTNKIRSWQELECAQWLGKETSPGKTNTEKIFSINLLKELINYNRTGNFDRAIAFFFALSLDKDMYKVQLEEMKEKSKKKLFGGHFDRLGWTTDTTNIGKFTEG